MVLCYITDMHFKLSENYLSAESGDTVIILELESGNYLEANGTGKRILNLIHLKKNKQEIISLLATEYDAPTDIIENDIDLFLNELIEAGILEQIS